MTVLDDYTKKLAAGTGNPAPVDAIALVFREGRALVCVRFHRSDRWVELMSAPGTAEDGLACGVDLRQRDAIAAACHASASTEEIPWRTYRCKHTVEAMRWTDTDDDREKFAAWFERHGAVFETRGPIALLPDLVTREDGDHNRVIVGEWILWMDGEFIAMEHELFAADYEEVSP